MPSTIRPITITPKLGASAHVVAPMRNPIASSRIVRLRPQLSARRPPSIAPMAAPNSSDERDDREAAVVRARGERRQRRLDIRGLVCGGRHA
jgi:hypothetical protein